MYSTVHHLSGGLLTAKKVCSRASFNQSLARKKYYIGRIGEMIV